ncbi:hypothetical protein MmiEs2_16530 [Methanimicrococcus stummii]|uniref:Uncharacterized protein n=1 Tax=Methanimicrococcus stummii TaxID=3028294 RepID=A0AA96V9U0_9EURY|nr:hypothetical protein [Methanimicrococcus sp. Es2]WNY29424.1 hypothetical protein MmiEs2_16530 [Methanimicrococcus sp. Es2]
MKFKNRFLIILALLCVLGLASCGMAAADSVTFYANGGSFVNYGGATDVGWSYTPGATIADANNDVLNTYTLTGPSGSYFYGWFNSNLVTGAGSTFVASNLNNKLPDATPLADGTAYYAIWAYNITLNPNGGDLGLGTDVSKTVVVQYGHTNAQVLALLDSSTYSSPWTFNGWYKVNDSGVVSDLYIGNTPRNINLYAGYAKPITVKTNGGTIQNPGYIDPDKFVSVTYPDVIVKIQPAMSDSQIYSALYNAVGGSRTNVQLGTWSIGKPQLSDESWGTASGIITPFNKWTPATGSPTYISWIGNVTFDANNGTIGGGQGSSKTVKVQYYDSAPHSSNPAAVWSYEIPMISMTNWNFGGWYATKGANGVVDENSKLDDRYHVFTPGVTYHAGWFKSIDVNPNGGKINSNPATQTLQVQYAHTIADMNSLISATFGGSPSYNPWAQDGWYTSANDKVVDVNTKLGTGKLGDMLGANTVVYAGWFGNINLDANGGTFGSGGPTSKTVKIQPANTYDQINGLINAEIGSDLPENGDWDENKWYKNAMSGTPGVILNTSTYEWTSGGLNVGDTLFIAWTTPIELNANRGEFGLGSGVETLDIIIQQANTKTEIEALIAAEIGSNNPVKNDINGDAWKLNTTNPWFKENDTSAARDHVVDLTTQWTSGGLDVGDVLHLGWFADIHLNANNGQFPGISSDVASVTIQHNNTKTEIEALIAALSPALGTPVNGAWTAESGWYKMEDVTPPVTTPVAFDLDDDKWTDTVDDGCLNVEDALFIAWTTNLELNANSGTFESTGTETDFVKIQEAHDKADIIALIDEIVDLNPTKGDWVPKVWYKGAPTNPTNPTNNVVDLTSEWTNGGLAANQKLYVGWFGNITLNLNGGEFDILLTEEEEIEVQFNETLDAIVTRTGLTWDHTGNWNFDNWYLPEDTDETTSKISGTRLVDFETLTPVVSATHTFNVDDILYAGWIGDVAFDVGTNGGAFLENTTLVPPVAAGDTFYFMFNVQPGEDLRQRIPASVYSGYHISKWIYNSGGANDGNTWNYFFEDNYEIVTAEWVRNSGSGTGYGSATVSGGGSSGGFSSGLPPADNGNEVSSEIETTPEDKSSGDNADPKTETVPAEKKNNTRTYIIIAAVLIVVIALAAVYYFKFMKK